MTVFHVVSALSDASVLLMLEGNKGNFVLLRTDAEKALSVEFQRHN